MRHFKTRIVGGLFALAAVVLAGAAYHFLQPEPPAEVRIDVTYYQPHALVEGANNSAWVTLTNLGGQPVRLMGIANV